MDLQWRRAWMRKWIALGQRECLTYREIAARAGVCARTVARWNRVFQEEQLDRGSESGSEPQYRPIEMPEEPSEPLRTEPEPETSLIQPEDPESRPRDQILIELSKDRRIVIHGAFDVEAVVRLIAAVEAC